MSPVSGTGSFVIPYSGITNFQAPVKAYQGSNSVGNQLDHLLAVIAEQENAPETVGISLTIGGQERTTVDAGVAYYLGAHQADFPTLQLDTFA